MAKTTNEWLIDKAKCKSPQCEIINVHEYCRNCLIEKTDDFEQFLDDAYYDAMDKMRDCE